MSEMAPEPTIGCRCGRPTREARTVCETCLDGFTQALNECPWAETELAVTITGQQGIDYRRLGGSPSSEVRIPLHIGASDATAHLRAILSRWVLACVNQQIRNQSPKLGLPADTIGDMARWLLWRVDGLALSDQGPDAVDQITTAVDKARGVIDRPADRWFAGNCDNCGSGLYATAGANLVTCRTPIRNVAADNEVCGHTVDVADRRAKLLTEAEDRLATAADVARAVSWLGAAPLTSDRIRKWAERGRILPHGHDGRYPLYRVGDAIDLLAGEMKTG